MIEFIVILIILFLAVDAITYFIYKKDDSHSWFDIIPGAGLYYMYKNI